MNEIKIVIKSLTPSLNPLLRMNRFKRMKLKEDLAWEVFVELQEQNPGYEVIGTPRKMNLNIISYRKSFLDKDNFWGGLKPLVDAIKELRLIYDDSKEFLKWDAEQRIEKKRKNQRTEIIISRVGP
jgi:hypothetical protein